ncbi:MAG: lytic transglycosylase domain-containing protein [Oligoflexales bacterium]|nr:lytic transglycosylase domain-containing protein [Oligoflexales bacterium]
MLVSYLFAYPCQSQTAKESDLKKMTADQIALLKSQLQSYEGEGSQPSNGEFASSFLNHDYSSFQASNYLRFYQALSYLLASQNNKSSKKEKQAYLQHSLSLLDNIKFETKKQSFDLDHWRRQVIHQLIIFSFEDRAFFKVIKYAQLLADKPMRTEHLKLVALSYFETKQLTRFQRFTLKYPNLLEDEQINRTIKNRKILATLKKKISLNASQAAYRKGERIFHKRPEWSGFLAQIKESYFGDHLQAFRKFTNRYLEALESRGIDKKGRKAFVKEFEQSLTKVPPSLVLHYIRKMWQRQYLDKAVSASDVFLRQFKGHPDYSIVAYDRGRILEDQGKHSQALKSFKDHEKWIRGTTHEENHDFRKAWLSYLSKNKESSILFEDYLRKYPNGEYYSTCFYFLIEVLKTQKKVNRKHLKSRVERFTNSQPMNYYSLRLLKEWALPRSLVMNQLGGGARPVNHDANQIFSLGLREQHLWDLYLELREFGLHDDAYFVLTELSELLAKIPEWFAYSIKEAKHFEHPSFVTIKAPQVFYRFSQLKSYLSWKDIYPLLYKEQITENLKKLNSPLSYKFVVSLIRQESAFNPTAVSSANANGLMQIIPSTAKTLAQKLNLSDYDVFEPSVNIKLGISLLNRLYYKYDGRLDYMLSAYNAGDTVTDRWIRSRGRLSQLEFIESIPYKETRSYIKLIFRNMEFYDLIYDKSYLKTG